MTNTEVNMFSIDPESVAYSKFTNEVFALGRGELEGSLFAFYGSLEHADLELANKTAMGESVAEGHKVIAGVDIDYSSSSTANTAIFRHNTLGLWQRESRMKDGDVRRTSRWLNKIREERMKEIV